MSLKRDIAKEIRMLSSEIQMLEIKRSRSQAALIEALVSKRDPDPEDVQYFRAFTSQIEVKREQLQKLTKDLEKLL